MVTTSTALGLIGARKLGAPVPTNKLNSYQLGDILRFHGLKPVESLSRRVLETTLSQKAAIKLGTLVNKYGIREFQLHGQMSVPTLNDILENNQADDMLIVGGRVIFPMVKLETVVTGELGIRVHGKQDAFTRIWVTQSVETALRAILIDEGIKEIQFGHTLHNIRPLFESSEKVKDLGKQAIGKCLYICNGDKRNYPQPARALTAHNDPLANLALFNQTLRARGETVTDHRQAFEGFVRDNLYSIALSLFHENKEIQELKAGRTIHGLESSGQQALSLKIQNLNRAVDTLVQCLIELADHGLNNKLIDQFWEISRERKEADLFDCVEILLAVAEPLADKFPLAQYFQEDITTYKDLQKRGLVDRRSYLEVVVNLWDLHLEAMRETLPPTPKVTKKKGKGGKKGKTVKPHLPREVKEFNGLEREQRRRREELDALQLEERKKMSHAWAEVVANNRFDEMIALLDTPGGTDFIEKKLHASSTTKHELTKIFELAQKKEGELLKVNDEDMLDNEIDTLLDSYPLIFDLINTRTKAEARKIIYPESYPPHAIRVGSLELTKMICLELLFERMEREKVGFNLIRILSQGSSSNGEPAKAYSTKTHMAEVTGTSPNDGAITLFLLKVAEAGRHYLVWDKKLQENYKPGNTNYSHWALFAHHNIDKFIFEGRVLMWKERYEEAAERFIIALEALPESTIIRQATSICFSQAGANTLNEGASHKYAGNMKGLWEKVDQAEKKLNRALELWPENPRALDGLAKIEEERGNNQKARELLEKCYVALQDKEIVSVSVIKKPEDFKARIRGRIGSILLKIALADDEHKNLELLAQAEEHLTFAFEKMPLKAGHAYELTSTILAQEKYKEAFAFVGRIAEEAGLFPENAPERAKILADSVSILLELNARMKAGEKNSGLIAMLLPKVVARTKTDFSIPEIIEAHLGGVEGLIPQARMVAFMSLYGPPIYANQMIDFFVGNKETAILFLGYSYLQSVFFSETGNLSISNALLQPILNSDVSMEIPAEKDHTGIDGNGKANAYNLLAVNQRDSNKAKEAEATLTKALAEFPNYPILLNTMATVQKALGKMDKAREYGRRSFEVCPDFMLGRLNLYSSLCLEDQAQADVIARGALAQLKSILQDKEKTKYVIHPLMVTFLLGLASDTQNIYLIRMIHLLKENGQGSLVESLAKSMFKEEKISEAIYKVAMKKG